MNVLSKVAKALKANSILTRSRGNPLSGIIGGPQGERNIDEVLGYPVEVEEGDLYEMYERLGIATRITRGVARSCWRVVPEIKVGDKVILEKEMLFLHKQGFFKAMEKADTLNRIGNFSVLFIGVPDGQDFDQPLGRVTGNAEAALKATYFRPYRQCDVNVVKWETDASSPRFGKPEIYQLSARLNGDTNILEKEITINAHWTRIIHMAEDALDSELVGMSSLLPVYNSLLDLKKTTGSASEAFWVNAQRVFTLKLDPGIATSDLTDENGSFDGLKKMFNDFVNKARNFIALTGVTATQHTVPTADPKETVLANFKMVSGYSGIALRILTGEGGGQTTGVEDKASYNELIYERQNSDCSPWLFQALNIFGKSGLIPVVPDNAEAEWPITKSLNELQASEARKNDAIALNNVSQALSPMGGLADDMGGEQVITEFLDMEYKPVTDAFSEDLDGTE